MSDFRMMPRQAPFPDRVHTRYGFMIEGHPKGDPGQNGLYFASWEDYDTAIAAAFCLGVDYRRVDASTYFPASQIRRI